MVERKVEEIPIVENWIPTKTIVEYKGFKVDEKATIHMDPTCYPYIADAVQYFEAGILDVTSLKLYVEYSRLLWVGRKRQHEKS